MKKFLLSIALVLIYTGVPFAAERPNVVMVLIDALRKDHVSAYGYERKTTPVIDSLANDGLLFENAFSQSTFTNMSLPCIFTSKYPFQISSTRMGAQAGAKDSGFARLPDNLTTLAQALSDNGYLTGCISNTVFISESTGLWRGFNKTNYLKQAKADKAIDTAIGFIRDSRASDKGRPFFAYIHLMDVHEPTNPPKPYDTMYPTLDSAPHNAKQQRWDYVNATDLDSKGFAVFKSHKLALYDGGLTYADAQIGRLVDYLKKENLYDNTVFIITADHGEEFWEHAAVEKQYHTDNIGRYGVGHGHTLFRELQEVPLVFSGKGVPKSRVKQMVRSIDIMPTILGLAGVKTAPKMEGVDLIGSLRRKELKDIPIFCESQVKGAPMVSLQDTRYKYIRLQQAGGAVEFLFDKSKDYGETDNVAGKYPEIRKAMAAQVDKIRAAPAAPRAKPMKIDKDALEKLKSLGYIQ